MVELTSIVVSGVVWDALKKGISITTGFLKKKLSKWILDDAELEEIKEYVSNIPEAYLISEGMIREYINLSDRMLSIFEKAKVADVHIFQDINGNNNIVIGNNPGEVNINNYVNDEQPRPTQGAMLSLVGNRPKYSPIQIVSSFLNTRDKCIIENESDVYADIVIPEEVKKREGCQFSMILFSYIPSENWLNYFDEKYKMRFIIETSENIKQVQFQIKNSRQHQFVDISIDSREFLCPLSELARREAWKDICEICFTVFASDQCIVGEKGYIRLKRFQLER